MLKVYPVSKVPADGIVVWGSNHVNQSMITSGSPPMSKEVWGDNHRRHYELKRGSSHSSDNK